MNSVPVEFDHVWGGFGRSSALLRDEGSHLALEYRLEDAILGVFRTEVKVVRLRSEELAGVEWNGSWLGFGGQIILRATRLTTFESLPCADGVTLKLTVKRPDRDAGKAFVEGLHVPEKAKE